MNRIALLQAHASVPQVHHPRPGRSAGRQALCAWRSSMARPTLPLVRRRLPEDRRGGPRQGRRIWLQHAVGARPSGLAASVPLLRRAVHWSIGSAVVLRHLPRRRQARFRPQGSAKRSRRRYEVRNALTSVCRHCGKRQTALRSSKRFCSVTCRVAAHRGAPATFRAEGRRSGAQGRPFVSRSTSRRIASL
jgi:hypothetical protein